MKMLLNLTLKDKVPPSDNHIYKRSPNGPGVYLTPEGKAWKEDLAYCAKVSCTQPEPSPKPIEVIIVITFSTKHLNDIQNRIKLTLDAIEGVVYNNDCQIVKLTLFKRFGQAKETKIEVWEL